MKLEFFKRGAVEQALVIRETAARRGLLPVMAEKDFWVSWILAVLFGHPEFGVQLVFKGGTSLSKVFGVIGRFSEDIDLSVSPAFLGIREEYVESADSRGKATARMQELETACIEQVRERFVPELERIARESLGKRAGGKAWMEFQVDTATHSPVVLFQYLARPGSFRLVPPDFRLAELAADYAKMRPMFLTEPPPFVQVVETVRALEHQINR